MDNKRFVVLYIVLSDDRKSLDVRVSKRLDKAEAKRFILDHHGCGREYPVDKQDSQGTGVLRAYRQMVLATYSQRFLQTLAMSDKGISDVPVTREKPKSVTEEEVREAYRLLKERGAIRSISENEYVDYKLHHKEYKKQIPSANENKRHADDILLVNLEAGLPRVVEAMLRLENALAGSKYRYAAIKIIHGRGHLGPEGAIRIATHRKLQVWKEENVIRDYIYGEDFHIYNQATYNALAQIPKLKQYYDSGDAGNEGVSFILL